MQLNPAATARLRGAQPRGEALVTIFEHLVEIYKQAETAAVLTLDYAVEGDEAVEGDLIPTITLSLRKPACSAG